MNVRRRVSLGVVSCALLSGCTSAPIEDPVPSATPATPTAVDGSFDVGEGRTLHMECRGEGSPTVIMEAGDEGGVEQWSQVMPDVADLTRTCAYDRAGVGLSDPATGCRGLDDLTGDLEALLTAAAIPGPYVLVASSGGGYIASGFAADHRDAIAGVVFVDVPGPFLDPPPDLVDFLKCDAPTNIERRDYLGVEHAGWDARAEIGDIPVTVMSVDYGSDATMEAEKTNVDVQRGWLVFSPRATQVVVHTGHDIVGEDPQHVIEEVARVLEATPPPEGRILYSRIRDSGVTDFFEANPDGSSETPFAVGEAIEPRNLSPDGSRLAVVAEIGEGAFVAGTIGIDGSGLRLFSKHDPTLNLACGVWASPRRLACEGWDDSDPSRNGIYTVRASDGGAVKQLTRARDVPCEYSPDGTQLAFVRTGTDPQLGALMVMDAEGGDARPLFDDVELTGIACDWSPDGTRILTGGADGRLVMVALDGASSPFVGEGIGGFAAGGTWSPDGSHILFSMTFEGAQWDVYVAAADGSNLTRITDSPLIEEGGIWLP